MDFDEYVAARRARLVEYAVDRGFPTEDAPSLVDTVLAQQRRRITRADDPHPETLAAVDRALARTREQAVPPGEQASRRRRRRLLLGSSLGAVLLAAATVVLLPDPPEVRTLPSYFGYTAADATRDLQQDGFDVVQRPSRACEPQGLTMGTEPPAGARIVRGSTVTVRPAVASGDSCLAVYGARSDAWAFVRWVRGGASPAFASTVNVIIDGQGPRSVYLGEASSREPFGPIIETLATAFATPATTDNGVPRLVVSTGAPPPEQCGVPRPAAGGDRPSLRLQVDPTPAGGTPCPLTVDLFRSAAGIDSMVVYSAKPPPDPA
ncbi:MAG: PASTA domain-containing protein [Nocardioides sp.]|nr:PASTA domain-containing protein [Nocardioides sp.]